MTSWETARSADGPRVAEWIDREVGKLTGKDHPTPARAWNKWKAGGMADFYALDKYLTLCHRHVSEVPEEFWIDKPANHPTGRSTDPRTKRRPRQVPEVKPKPCAACGEPIPLVYPNGRRLEPARYETQKYCCRECGWEALKGRPRRLRPKVAA